ncbi:MAG: pyridoxal 5'-phosphate synthase glutaminase subunit PdxT [candidate division Zixibacteria bacterium]|nr:pyridoxal 5'-phosphate synthase glutaminase subunit PdxT [candidate division Zixibacteria bacterium]MDD5426023.1 pyridoxal 5'-phosphate synthase glutaminase subunit PdxT [candidate division Zixibacteria bacterium]
MKTYKDFHVGILTLQGDFEKHQRQVRSLGAVPEAVRLPGDLIGLDALIIPGGESSTMSVLIDRFALRAPLLEFARTHPVYGTCAGMILLARKIEDNISGVEPLALIDIDVRRNGYGRQVFSFETDIEVTLENGTKTVRGFFIRAPKITRVGEGVGVLAEYQARPVLVRQNNILASSFHSELNDDLTVLKYFVDILL